MYAVSTVNLIHFLLSPSSCFQNLPLSSCSTSSVLIYFYSLGKMNSSDSITYSIESNPSLVRSLRRRTPWIWFSKAKKLQKLLSELSLRSRSVITYFRNKTEREKLLYETMPSLTRFFWGNKKEKSEGRILMIRSSLKSIYFLPYQAFDSERSFVRLCFWEIYQGFDSERSFYI